MICSLRELNLHCNDIDCNSSNNNGPDFQKSNDNLCNGENGNNQEMIHYQTTLEFKNNNSISITPIPVSYPNSNPNYNRFKHNLDLDEYNILSSFVGLHSRKQFLAKSIERRNYDNKSKGMERIEDWSIGERDWKWDKQ